MCKAANLDDMGININSKALTRLRFADNFVSIADHVNKTIAMLEAYVAFYK